jgi:F-type H+-transporting ATPase subunit b
VRRPRLPARLTLKRIGMISLVYASLRGRQRESSAEPLEKRTRKRPKNPQTQFDTQNWALLKEDVQHKIWVSSVGIDPIYLILRGFLNRMDVILHQLGGLPILHKLGQIPIMQQLGQLFLASVPTIILFLLIVTLYWTLVYGPLMRVLEERRERTAGAVERANGAIAAADEKAQEYETRLREARLSVFEAREERLRQWNGQRETALKEARGAAQLRVAAAKVNLLQETEAAHRTLESSAEELAKEVLRAILPSESTPALAPAGSGR